MRKTSRKRKAERREPLHVQRLRDVDVDLTPPERRVHPWQIRVDLPNEMYVQISQPIPSNYPKGLKSDRWVVLDGALFAQSRQPEGTFEAVSVFDLYTVSLGTLEEFARALLACVKTVKADHLVLVD